MKSEKIIGYLDATKTEINKFKSASIYNQKGIQCNGTSKHKEVCQMWIDTAPKYLRNRKVYELVLREVKK